MKFLSVCSGIEAASVAWKPLGWDCVAVSEIERRPSEILAHHYPDVPNWGDMTKYEQWPERSIDLLVGGTPCQGFSVAGKRGGMDDPRSQLAHSFAGIAAKYRPRWLVWENVPGALSTNGGQDFAGFISGLAHIGYQCAWRILDAQYFGLAQRRKRLFVVGSVDWRRAAAVLFERESLRGDSPPSRKAGESVTGKLASRTTAGGGLGTDMELNGGLVMQTASGKDVFPSLTASQGDKLWLGNQEAMSGDFFVQGFNNRQDVCISGEVSNPLGAKDNGLAVAYGGGRKEPVRVASTLTTNAGLDFDSETFVCYDTTQVTSKANNSNPRPGDPCHTLVANGDAPLLTPQVRRLMPVECERLQGFPDGYTAQGKDEIADGPRYKALGNSMAVPVMRWIGERIQKVERLINAH